MASQNGSLYPLVNSSEPLRFCYFRNTGLYIIPAYTVVWTLLLFTLGFLVLHTGFQRWRQNKLSTVSHTDFFTYNALILEVIRFCGYVVYSLGSLQAIDSAAKWGLRLITLVFPGLLSFHVLVCIERYLAVVYPVAYLSLRKRQWMWLRKWIIVIVWAFCAIWKYLLYIVKPRNFYIPLLSVLGPAACIIFFCSSHVLHSLRNPSPGEGGGVSQAKRRAFKTMLIIFVALMLWLDEAIARILIDKVDILDDDEMCKLLKSACWFELPSSLVLPLVFLHRAGKLPKCRAVLGGTC